MDGKEKAEQPLQAILLADSFTRTFRPISRETPKVLQPLVNIPMLHYTIEFLASAGVEELFIFCVDNKSMFDEFLAAREWTLKITVISSSSCLSAGDALREVDQRQLIRSDPFVLISGDVISNMSLKGVIAEHRARRKKDNSCIMTSVFKQCKTDHPSRPLVDDLVLAMDKKSKQILLYDDDLSHSNAVLPIEFFRDGHYQVQFRYDLMDCHIDICSPEVLLQFSDNFDYQDIREHFIHNEVANLELGNHIYAHVIQNEYAARIHDFRTYHMVSKDIIHRWVYPFVPDNNCLGDTTYQYQRRSVYKEAPVTLARSCVVGEEVVIGRGTSVGASSSIANAVIGRNCKIGENVTLVGSHVWDGAVIEDGASVKHAIICNGAIVNEGAVVQRGCVLSYGVVIGKGHTVPEFSHITKCKEDDGFGDSDDDGKNTVGAEDWEPEIVGAGGEGFLWKDESEDESDEDEDGEGEKSQSKKLRQQIGSAEAERERRRDWAVWEYADSDEEEDFEYEEEDEETKLAQFVQNVHDMVTHATREGHDADNVFIEIKGLKFAQNRTFLDCIEGIVFAVCDLVRADESVKGQDMKKVMHFKKNLTKWDMVLKKCLVTPFEEMGLIKLLERYVLQHRAEFEGIFRFLLQLLYDGEKVSENVLLKWIEERRGTAPGPERELFDLPAIQQFVEWLEEEEEDEGSDEENSSEEDSDDSDD